LDVLEPLEPSIWNFEHCKVLFLSVRANNIKYPLESRPRDVALERGELLYHLMCYVFTVGYWLLIVGYYVHLKCEKYLIYVFEN
jgi:hypothetical protein